MMNVAIFYVGKRTETEGVLQAISIPHLPNLLADNLINGNVTSEVQNFLDNLASLQGFIGADFQKAYEDIPEEVDSDDKKGADSDE